MVALEHPRLAGHPKVGPVTGVESWNRCTTDRPEDIQFESPMAAKEQRNMTGEHLLDLATTDLQNCPRR